DNASNLYAYNTNLPTGLVDAATIAAPATNDAADVVIGGFAGALGGTATGLGFYNGMIDEIVISTVARDSNWVRLTYANQNPNQTLVDVGAPAAAAVPGAPTAVVATAGNAQASVVWAAPSSNGGATI